MKQSELIQLINAPQNATAADLDKLDVLTREFPFFQSAHVLLTLTSKKHNSSLYQQTLKNTAISVPNRSRLHYLLNFKEVDKAVIIAQEKQTEKVLETKEIIKPISEIDHLKMVELEAEKGFTEEQLNEQVEKEIEKQIVSVIVEKQILEIPEKEKKEEAKKTITEGSFSDWLNVLKEGKPETEFEETLKTQETDSKIQDTPRTDKKLQQKSIIDKIIEKNPGQIRFKEDQKFFASDNKAKESLFENEDIVTATLADIYAKQGNIPKAIRAYEILSLKFPQKSAYFASLIENLKKK